MAYTDYHGIDYGMGKTNVDPNNGIRNGVLLADLVLTVWSEESIPDYGPACCPSCGNEAIDISESGEDGTIPDLYGDPEGWEIDGFDLACPFCNRAFWFDELCCQEPLSFSVDGNEYSAVQDCDSPYIFFMRSPYYTFAQYCSPCAPGACYLANPTDGDGPKAYCPAPNWFEYYEGNDFVKCTGEYDGVKTSCPYPVYRVSDGACVFMPKGFEGK